MPDDSGAATVRPYVVTGGRTGGACADLPLEALVQGLGATGDGSPEKRRMLELTTSRHWSIAELAGELRLPVSVVRVVVADLIQEGRAQVHGGGTTWSTDFQASSVLETLLDGSAAH